MPSLHPIVRQNIIQALEELDRRWRLKARPAQIAPDWLWTLWLQLGGRGSGKTRSAGEWIRECIEKEVYGRYIFVARTAGDIRDTMVEGESGLLTLKWKSGFYPRYQPSKNRLVWDNGAIANLYSAEEPDRFRGPQCQAFWADELAHWKYPDLAWDNLMFGFRLPPHPQGVISTTPRPIKLLKELIERAKQGHKPASDVAISKMTTYDNRANLAPSFYNNVITKYEGTRIGRQELLAELLEDVEGALWTQQMLDNSRMQPDDTPDLVRVITGVDPTGSTTNECGIVTAGQGVDGHGYTLEDASCEGSPDMWGHRAVNQYRKWQADAIAVETNYGGDMCKHVIQTIDPMIKIIELHASRGKIVRAEPVAALWEQLRAHHAGEFTELEEEQCTYVPGNKSPNRMDAMVWAYTELMLGELKESPGFW